MNPFERIDMLIGYAGMMDDNLFINQLQKLKEEIMSISSPMIDNPVKKYIECRSDEKRFTYFDKSKGEKVEIPLPFYITILDELATVSGYNDPNNCGFKSNEVHNPAKDHLYVKTWKGDFKAEGLWQDIKAQCKEAGGKFTRSVYALLSVSKTEKELVNIQLSGMGNSKWIDLNAKAAKHIVKFCDVWETGGKGKTVYNMPTFELIPITDELLAEGIKVDTEVLQPYFKARGVYKDEKPDSDMSAGDESQTTATPPGENDLPF